MRWQFEIIFLAVLFFNLAEMFNFFIGFSYYVICAKIRTFSFSSYWAFSYFEWPRKILVVYLKLSFVCSWVLATPAPSRSGSRWRQEANLPTYTVYMSEFSLPIFKYVLRHLLDAADPRVKDWDPDPFSSLSQKIIILIVWKIVNSALSMTQLPNVFYFNWFALYRNPL